MSNRFVAFDIDGTLFSSEDILGGCYEKAIAIFNSNHKKQLTMPPISAIFNLVGQPSLVIYATLFPELDEDEVDEMCAMVRNFLVEMVNLKKGHYYDGVWEMLKKLSSKGYKLLAASNGGYEYVTAVIKNVPAIDLFEKIEVLNYKTIHNKCDLLKFYIQKYGINPSDMVMVGDRTSDIEAAFGANTHFIAAMYGHGNPTEVKAAKHFAYTPSEIGGLVDEVIFQSPKTTIK